MKRMVSKRVLFIALCGILLVIGMTFSDFGSVKAYAADPTRLENHIEVSISKTPVSGESTDISGLTLTVPEGCHYSARIDDRTDGAGNYWFNNSKIARAGSTFLGGDEYRLAVIITADDGYCFNKAEMQYGVATVTTTVGGTGVFSENYVYNTSEGTVKSCVVFLVFDCESKQYTVSFDKGNGVDSASGTKMPSQTVNEGAYTLPECLFTAPTNEKFSGWAVGSKSATPLKQPGEKYDLRADTTIYAIYESTLPKTYELNVNYDTNCGTVLVNVNGREDNSGKFEKGTSLNLVPLPKSGWLVDEWTFDPTVSVSFYGENNDRVSFNMPGNALNATLTFKKAPTAKKITLNPQGGSVTSSEIMTDKDGYLLNPDGTSIDLPTPSKSGATFKWWSTTTDGTEYNKNAKYEVDTTLYAVYETEPGPGGDSDPTPGPDGDPTPTPKADYLDELRDLLNAAKAGDIVKWNKGTALPLDIMKLIVKKDVTLEFSYTYSNKAYVVVIDKNNVPTKEVPWYGPLYLASLTKTSKSLNGYVIKPGDTLNGIAKKFNTTVAELLKKNPTIVNPNLIYAGRRMEY